MQTLQSVLNWVLGTIVVAFVGTGSYLAAYLKKRAENLATHEDLHKLIEQVKAVTRETEAIKAEITSGLWDRQKRWEVRRDILFELVRSAVRVDPVLRELVSCLRAKPKQAEAQEAWKRLYIAVSQKWLDISSEWEGAKGLSDVVSGEELEEASSAWFRLRTRILNKVSNGDTDFYSASFRALGQSSSRLYAAVRKELGLDEFSEFSSESCRDAPKES